MQKIFVLYTGGTIGMVQGENGLQPNQSIVHQALMPYQQQFKFHWHICEPLIDSSAITPHNWSEWLNIIQTVLPQYDGVLILHGTDTLAYTANFFSLSLDTHNKPIILTGSQKPFGTPNSDAQNNLQTAIYALQNKQIQQVMLAFHGKLFPAIGTNKCSTETDDGFINTHFGTWLPEKNITTNQTIAHSKLKRHFNPNSKVAAFILTPGIATQTIANSLNQNQLDAAILMSYGHGNTPADITFLQSIQNFTQQNKPILNISQVAQGNVSNVYAQGSALRQTGIINAGKCTLETAIPLLMLAVSNQWATSDIITELQRLQLI